MLRARVEDSDGSTHSHLPIGRQRRVDQSLPCAGRQNHRDDSKIQNDNAPAVFQTPAMTNRRWNGDVPARRRRLAEWFYEPAMYFVKSLSSTKQTHNS